jgi:predicted Zn-dependent protease
LHIFVIYACLVPRKNPALKAILNLFILSTLLSGLSCNQGSSGKGTYAVALMSFGKTSKLTREQAAQTCSNLLNDSVRVVSITWLQDSIPAAPAYYQPRNRYRAEVLLQAVRKIRKHNRDKFDAVILVTDLPVSTSLHGKYDYGICGLSGLGDGASVVSAHGLDRVMFCQTLRHEWGHGIGLQHCRENNCIMNDAHGKIRNLQGHGRFGEDCYQFAARKHR